MIPDSPTVDLDAETQTLIALAIGSLPPAPPHDETLGSPENPYDLAAPARVIIPVATPLLNQLPVVTVDDAPAKATENTVTVQVQLRDHLSDVAARSFAECIVALKLTEEHFAYVRIANWLLDHATNEMPWAQTFITHTPTAEAIAGALALGIRYGVSRDYYGVQLSQPDGSVTYRVIRHAEVIFPD